MFDTLDVFRLAHGLAVHASARQAQVAQNVANADTPGYRARDLAPFDQVYDAPQAPLRSTRAGHLAAAPDRPARIEAVDAPGFSAPNGNTVSLEAEMIRAADVKRSHDMALAVYTSSLDILRASLGRPR